MTLRRWALSAWMFVSCATLAFACGDNQAEPENQCDPGTNIFCRCPGGEAGTRECLDDGDSFGECVVAPGTPCGDRIECVEGETVPCLCPSGEPGVKSCLRDGASYGICETAPDVPCPIAPDPEGSPASSSSSGGPGTGGAGGAPANCTHDVCDQGDPLDPACGDCEAAVCAADSYCCDTAWDGLCLQVADEECNYVCSGPPACEHPVCEQGTPLVSGCNACVTEVCTSDPFCCGDSMGDWDSVCVSKVFDTANYPSCAGLCCAHDACMEGVKLESTCSPCVTAVCGIDPYCCDNQWDQFCVQKAQDEPSCGCT